MHFRHHSTHSTSENAEAFVQDPVGEDIPVNASQASLLSQDSSHIRRKLSERIHEKLKAVPDHLSLTDQWRQEESEVIRKHKERHHLHSEASLTNILAGSAAAAGYGGAAVHASTFPVVRDDHHDFIAPGYDAPSFDAPSYNYLGYSQDQYPPQASATPSHRSTARIGSQESGITNGYDDNYEPQLPAPRSTARELANESLSFITGPPSDNGNFPQATQATRRQHPAPGQQLLDTNPPSQVPHRSASTSADANLHPAQLQIRAKAPTPPYPSQPNISVQPCTAEVTVKSIPHIIEIIRQLQIEGFFHPSNVAFLPSQLEERLRKNGLLGAMGGTAAAAEVQVPGCMPDARGFGGQCEEGGERDVGEGEREVGDGQGGEIAGDEDHEVEDGDSGFENESHAEAEEEEGAEDEGAEDEGAEHGGAEHENECEHAEASEDEGHEAEDADSRFVEDSHDEAEDNDGGAEHECGHVEASEDEGYGEGEEAGETGEQEHREESEGEQGEHEDEDASGEHEDEADEGETEEGEAEDEEREHDDECDEGEE